MIASGHKGWFIFCLVVAVGAVGLAIVAAVPDVKGWLGGGLLASRIGDQPEAEESIAVRQQAVGISVPRVVANFMGRDELLAQLDAALSADRADVIIQVISGLGGVGKSQLAAAYVQAHRDDFDHVAWVRAGEDGGIADLGALAEELTLPVAGLIPAERANAVLMFLGKLIAVGCW